MKRALILGSTGLTGSCLLEMLLKSPDYEKVIIYVRKSSHQIHPKLEEKVVDYESYEECVSANDVFCCLGTTIKKAKTKEAFTKVDLAYPVKFANIQYKAGSSKFLVVSAMGADRHSRIFYSRTKGEMEDQLQKIGYPSVSIFRPSFITGDRKEKRMGESIGIQLFKLISPLLIGSLRKYRPVSANAIAAAMLQEANSHRTGTTILLSDEINKFA